jgi:hypothetical protein
VDRVGSFPVTGRVVDSRAAAITAAAA